MRSLSVVLAALIVTPSLAHAQGEATAIGLSLRISQDIARDAPAATAHYQGRHFVLSGKVGQTDAFNGFDIVTFAIPEPEDEHLPRRERTRFKTDITCRMAAGQRAFFRQLKAGKSIKLSGSFDSLNTETHSLFLKDCRPAK